MSYSAEPDYDNFIRVKLILLSGHICILRFAWIYFKTVRITFF